MDPAMRQMAEYDAACMEKMKRTLEDYIQWLKSLTPEQIREIKLTAKQNYA